MAFRVSVRFQLGGGIRARGIKKASEVPRAWPVRGFRCYAGPSEPKLSLGSSGVLVSPLGIGTRRWGDVQEGFGSFFDEERLSLVFEAAVASGCNFFDTDEIYGYQSLQKGQQAEQVLGRQKALWSHPSRPEIVIGTKYCPLPWANSFVGGPVRSGRASMLPALRASMQRLSTEQVDLWQIQNPIEDFNEGFVAGRASARRSSRGSSKRSECATSARRSWRRPSRSPRSTGCRSRATR
uniref:Aldo keto reductase n=2 Tax=Tetraselmis sp. GSL018 TaxID=582737 RepID=A0A061QP55_9CHLO